MEERKHIVILAAGDFPSHAVPLKALREADMVICCDSAYSEWKEESGKWKEKIPFVVVGDGDSLTEAGKLTLGTRWMQVDEQDYNDLHKAMAWAASQFTIHNSQFTILAATGKREDHTLGNIGYLVTFAEEHPGAQIEMLTDHGRLVAMRGRRTFASFPGQQVSVFSMNPDLPIYGQGLKWSLDGFHARRWWQATLNEAVGTEVSLCSDGWLVVFMTYEAKIPTASV